MVDKGRSGSGEEKKELMMLANISPCISILFRKWLSGFEAAWSSIASDSQPGCHCPLDQAGIDKSSALRQGRGCSTVSS